jgi:hypothetical protein
MVAEVVERLPSTARIRCRISEHSAEFTFLSPDVGRRMAESSCHSRRRKAYSTE